MHFTNCVALDTVLFTTLAENLRLCFLLRLGLFLICS